MCVFSNALCEGLKSVLGTNKNTVSEKTNCFQKLPQHAHVAVTALLVGRRRGVTVRSAVRTDKQNIYAREIWFRLMAQAISGRPAICGAKGTLWQDFSPSTSVFPCQYHSTIAPYSFIHLPPTLYNVFLPVLQFSSVSTIPPLLHTHSFTTRIFQVSIFVRTPNVMSEVFVDFLSHWRHVKD